MIAIGRVTDVTYGKSTINRVSGPNPRPQYPMKPPEMPPMPTIPDNDADIASINTNPLRGELADIQSAFRRNIASTSWLQNYWQLRANLLQKREQISEQVKELARLESKEKDEKAQQQVLQEKIAAFRQQISDIVNKALSNGIKIFTAAGQDMAICVGDDDVINIPAKDLGVNLTDVDLSENPDTLLEKVKRAIQDLIDNGEFLLGVRVKIEPFTTLMEFEFQDALNVEEQTAEKNITLELAEFSLARILQDTRKALHGQANVSPAAAAVLLLNTN